ncbi:agmatinase [Candidatus Peregrinibacteria bacterium]|nr:agmatinase [Candidatus Peregrinibacteria bacterium]
MKLNFGGIPEEFTDYDRSRIVILPVPYDGTSTWMKGADKGPLKAIEASPQIEWYDSELDFEVYKEGIFTDEALTVPSEPAAMVSVVGQRVSFHLKNGKFVMMLGGEHSVSIGAVKAFHEKFSDMTVLQLDAHSDLRDEYLGSKYNHACVMARVGEMCSFTQVGIRSMDISEKARMDIKRVFWARDIYSNRKWIPKVLSQLGKNVYVTIDVDVFDPSIMPSTGTPEPGGLFWYDVMDLLKAVMREKNVVGFDVVELKPIAENPAPDFLVARLVYQLLGYRFAGK